MLTCNTKCLFSESPSAVKVVLAVVNLAGRFGRHGYTVFWRSAGREERDATERRSGSRRRLGRQNNASGCGPLPARVALLPLLPPSAVCRTFLLIYIYIGVKTLY